jgi:hypothetical protein
VHVYDNLHLVPELGTWCVLVRDSGEKEMVSQDVVMLGPEVTEPGMVEHVELQVQFFLI